MKYTFLKAFLSMFILLTLILNLLPAISVLAAPAAQHPLDPISDWNTFQGGGSTASSHAVAVDSSGNTYIVGSSNSTWGSPVRTYTNYDDSYVAKLDANGSMIWNTFLGGSSYDHSYAVAADGSGNIYVAGESYTSWGSPLQDFSIYSGVSQVFIAKLDAATGALLWNTFLGGSGYDESGSIAVSGGYMYLAGNSDLGPWGTPVRDYATGTDAFAVKLNAATGAIIWNTFLGGSGTDLGEAIAVDGSGNAYVIGSTDATWGSPIRAYSTGYENAFIAKLDVNGSLIWNTFLGSNAYDYGTGIAADTSGNIFVTGLSSGNWGNPVRPYSASGYDAFVSRLDATSGVLVWNTFLGSSGEDYGHGIAMDTSGNVYATGESNLTWGSPIQPHALSAEYDAYITKLDPVTGILLWNTFLGGSGADYGTGIALDGSGNIHLSGYTWGYSWGNPVRAFTGATDGFAAMLIAPVTTTPTPTPTTTFTPTVTETETMTPTATSTATETVTPIQAETMTATATPTATETVTPTQTEIPFTATSTVTKTSTGTQTATSTRTATPTVTKTVTKTATPGTVTLYSIAADDGTVAESSETSNVGGATNATSSTFVLGDNTTKQQYRGVLSFNTGSLPDTAAISGVTLKVKKQGVVGGGDPLAIFQGFMVDIKNGFFGTTTLEAADFQTVAAGPYGPFLPALVSNVYSINLTSGLSHINKLAANGGLTQIRLRFKLDDNNDAVANYLSLHSGNATLTADRPQLVITYTVP